MMQMFQAEDSFFIDNFVFLPFFPFLLFLRIMRKYCSQ